MAECKLNLLALSLIITGMEVFLLIMGDEDNFDRDSFVLLVVFFLLFFGCLDHLFGIFIKRWMSVIFLVFPAAILIILLKDIEDLPYTGACIAVAVFVRLVLAGVVAFFGDRDYGDFIFPEICMYLVLDILAFGLFFSLGRFASNYLSSRLLFVSLVILTLSGFQALIYEKKNNSFPFHFFVLLGVLTLLLPMKTEPLNWTPLLNAGYNLVSGIMDTIDEMNYKLSVAFENGSYTAGYNSFEARGNAISKQEKTQIIIESDDKPYLVFTDNESGKRLKVRRTVYLAGGRGRDYVNLVSFLNLLSINEVSKDRVALFSRLSKVKLEYAYLNTRDEIAPVNSIYLSAEGSGKSGRKEISSGIADKKHRKGYKLSARFLEIDYGSPYLIALLNEAGDVFKDGATKENMLSYEEACKYFKELYNAGLDEYMTQESYEETLLSINEFDDSLQVESAGEEGDGLESTDFLDVSGASEKMTDLAFEISGNADLTDYEKCKAIEKYLRQYPYSTSAQGGYDPRSDLSSATGMADIADRFLFDTQKGYCVHFTSAMVMLLRLNGIPARVSVGYRYVYPFETQDRYEVSSSLAHAWPEAYIEGAGWIPFEPTSGFLPAEDFTWHRLEESSIKNEQIKENLQIPRLEVKSEQDAAEDPENAIKREITPRLIKIAVIVGLSIAFIIFLLILGTIVFSKLRYKFSSAERKLEIDVQQIKKAIRHSYEKSTGNAFVDRGLLSDYVSAAPESLKGETKKVFSIYYRLLYREGEKIPLSIEESILARDLRLKYK